MTITPTIKTMHELRAWLGKEMAIGRWHCISQDSINRYAVACNDHNWVHVDVERCSKELPLKTTIAQGNLIYGLLCSIKRNVDIELPEVRTTLAYGCNKIRFSGVVPSGSRVRGHYALKEICELAPKTHLLIWKVTGELEGQAKPIMVAEWVQWQRLP